MGLGNNRGSLTFVNLTKGVFTVGKKGDQKTFTDLTGVVTDLTIDDDTFNDKTFKVLNIKVADDSGVYNMKIRFESGYARCFCNMIENADLSLPIMFAPKYEEPEGQQPKASMFMMQNGKPLKHRYTKANPGNLPPLVKVRFKDNDMWDNSAQMTYYTELLLNRIKPQLVPAIIAGEKTDFHRGGDGGPSGLGKNMDANSMTEPIDDLPF